MRKTTKALFATLAALSLGLTACGGPAPAAGGPDPVSGNSSISIGVIPVAEFFPVYVAQDQGFFKEAGLDVEIESMSNAASIVPSVLNGQLTFGTTATPPFLTAVEKKIPITAVANAGSTTSEAGKDTGAFIVRADSNIASPKDLAGKKVAVNALSSLPHVAAVARIAQDGADPSDVQFVAMPFADMQAALDQNRVDALLSVEPFMSQSIGAGAKVISPLYTDVYLPGTTHTLYFTSKQFAAANPETVTKFKESLAKANALVAKDPSILRSALVKHGGMPQATADRVNLPTYATSFNVAGMVDMAVKMKENGFLSSDLDVESSLLK